VSTNEEIARRYAAAAARFDLDEMTALRHPARQASWPQSGERVLGNDNDRRPRLTPRR
jgi:hypothetical protein